MKRILALSLAALMLILCLTACNTTDSNGSDGSGYTFVSGNAEIAIGQSAEDAIQKLGAYRSVNESASCGGIPGVDRVYTYAGFRVKTTPAEGGDIVCQIVLSDDSRKTPEGVYIGMPAADAKSLMSRTGNPETVGENLVYKSGDMKLQILIRDGYVVGIQYTTA